MLASAVISCGPQSRICVSNLIICQTNKSPGRFELGQSSQVRPMGKKKTRARFIRLRKCQQLWCAAEISSLICLSIWVHARTILACWSGVRNSLGGEVRERGYKQKEVCVVCALLRMEKSFARGAKLRSFSFCVVRNWLIVVWFHPRSQHTTFSIHHPVRSLSHTQLDLGPRSPSFAPAQYTVRVSACLKGDAISQSVEHKICDANIYFARLPGPCATFSPAKLIQFSI